MSFPYFDLLRCMLIHICSYHMPFVGIDVTMVVNLYLADTSKWCTDLGART
jgi:hypothetical protein